MKFSDVRFLKFNLILRVYMLGQSTFGIVFAGHAPDSLGARLTASGGRPAHMLLQVITILVFLGWLDVLINDLMPERYQFLWVRQRRHLGYAVLATSYGMRVFASFSMPLSFGGLMVLRIDYLFLFFISAWFTVASALRPNDAL